MGSDPPPRPGQRRPVRFENQARNVLGVVVGVRECPVEVIFCVDGVHSAYESAYTAMLHSDSDPLAM